MRFVQDSDNKMEETEKKTISNGYARKNDKHKSGASIPYLVLKVQDSQYAIDVAAVQSIIWLPELTPIAESPNYIIGVVNYHGNILYIIDLDIRFGYAPKNYQLDDKVIVLKHGDILMGVIVNEVIDIYKISPQEFECSPSYGKAGEETPHFLSGMVKKAGDIIMVIDYKKLLHFSMSNEILSSEQLLDTQTPGDDIKSVEHLVKHKYFAPEATRKEVEIYRKRSVDLMEKADSSELSEIISMAVINLNDEYYGLELEVVREFSEMRNTTPIPCCPDHIIGDMNVRGDVITLVDIRGVLNLHVTRSIKGNKGIIVQVDDILAGILVNDVFDMIVLDRNDVNPVPTAVQNEGNEFLKGTIFYKDKIVGILDLGKIFSKEGFVVDEEV